MIVEIVNNHSVLLQEQNTTRTDELWERMERKRQEREEKERWRDNGHDIPGFLTVECGDNVLASHAIAPPAVSSPARLNTPTPTQRYGSKPRLFASLLEPLNTHSFADTAEHRVEYGR
jgi:hypothetical protein